MYPYQNPNLPTEERINDLMSRMTLEEKILQTDQYYSGDFTTQDENGKVTAVDMQRFDALMQRNSVGSVQLRGMTAAPWDGTMYSATACLSLRRLLRTAKHATLCAATIPLTAFRYLWTMSC